MNDVMKKAIYETARKYGIINAVEACREYFESGQTNKFTRTNNARDNLDMFRPEPREVIREMEKSCPETLRVADVNQYLMQLIRAYVNKVVGEYEYNDINIYTQNLERCAMIGGVLELEEGDLGLPGNNLFASSRIGKRRKNQEDAVIVMEHPRNPEFKIMVVADGMGGMEKGEVASHMVVQHIKSWFENLDLKYYGQEECELGTKFTSIINKINENVCRELKQEGGSTFVGAIVGKTKTIIANVGDSRAYSYNRGRIKKLTKDDSLAQVLYDQGRIPEEDDMRFFVENNLITKSIGSGQMLDSKLIYLNNDGYEQLILASDGATDCLSEQQIERIVQTSNQNEVAKNIVEAANNIDSELREGLRKNQSADGKYYGENLEIYNNCLSNLEEPVIYNSRISGGKDNATVAVLVNNRTIELRKEENERDER